MRITKEQLENQVLLLNEFTGQNKEMFSKDDTQVQTGANIGHYYIDYSYGGVKLEQIVNNGGACREITNYRLTKRELYYVLHSMNNLLRNSKDRNKNWEQIFTEGV